MLGAAALGLAAGGALVAGALGAIVLGGRIPRRWIGLVVGFGVGVLIAALTFELTQEAYGHGGAAVVAGGLMSGAVLFAAGNRFSAYLGGANRKRSQGQHSGSDLGVALGSLLDGIPEAMVIGMGFAEGEGIGFALMGAVFLSNIPESFSATYGWRKERSPTPSYLARTAPAIALWAAIALASAGGAALGYGLLVDAAGELVGFIEALAAGAVLTMLVDTMLPEAFDYSPEASERGGHSGFDMPYGGLLGVVVTVGFACAFLLAQLD